MKGRWYEVFHTISDWWWLMKFLFRLDNIWSVNIKIAQYADKIKTSLAMASLCTHYAFFTHCDGHWIDKKKNTTKLHCCDSIKKKKIMNKRYARKPFCVMCCFFPPKLVVDFRFFALTELSWSGYQRRKWKNFLWPLILEMDSTYN